MSTSERTVEFGYLEDGTQLKSLVAQHDRDSNLSLSSITEAVPKFQKVERQSFIAEHAMKDGALVVHFYAPPSATRPYWSGTFPQMLDRTARDYFKAESPRLRAKYTEEFNSWWFQANGYDHVIDLAAFIRGFFDALDAALVQG